jgi:hypothetical protein
MFLYEQQSSEHNVTTNYVSLWTAVVWTQCNYAFNNTGLKISKKWVGWLSWQKRVSVFIAIPYRKADVRVFCCESPRAALDVVDKVIIAPVGSRILDVQQILEVWLFTPLTWAINCSCRKSNPGRSANTGGMAIHTLNLSNKLLLSEVESDRKSDV